MHHVVRVREERRLVPGRQREDEQVVLTARERCDALDRPDLLVAPLAGNVDDALAVKDVLQDLRPEDALGLAAARLADDVAVSAALLLREIQGSPPVAEDSAP